MSIKELGIKQVLLFIVVGGIVMFVAIILGIRVGMVFANQSPDRTPDSLANQTTMRLGEKVPNLPVVAADGRSLTLQEVTGGKPTVIGIVMPGCSACKKLLKTWDIHGIVNGVKGLQVILLAASTIDNRDLGELAQWGSHYPYYFCETGALDEFCGISNFPSVMGLKGDNTIGVIGSAEAMALDINFYQEYLK